MSDEFTPGVHVGNPAGYMVGAIQEGTSATAALNAFRDEGGEIRNETWYRLYGEVGDALNKSALAGQLDPYQIPAQSDLAPWTMGRGGEYATQVQVFFRDKDTGLIGHKEFTYTSSVPHTPAEAELAAFDEYGDQEVADQYDQAVLGTMTSNVFQTFAYGS